MNDFTKEELESMQSTILSMRIYTEIDTWDEELLCKIQSMIDNYDSKEFSCEHCGCLRSKNFPNAFCCGEYRDE